MDGLDLSYSYLNITELTVYIFQFFPMEFTSENDLLSKTQKI